MKPIVVHLRREVYESDAWKIIDWLGDMDIAKYLNESQNVCDSIRQTIYRVNLPILTHLFNRNGSFFIVADPDGPVGFTENKELLKEMQYSITLGEFVSLAQLKKEYLNRPAAFMALKPERIEQAIKPLNGLIK